MIRQIAYGLSSGGQAATPAPANSGGDDTIGGNLPSANKLTEQDLINAYIFYMLDNEGGVVKKSVEARQEEIEKRIEEEKSTAVNDKLIEKLSTSEKAELIATVLNDEDNYANTKIFLKDKGFTEEEIGIFVKNSEKSFSEIGKKPPGQALQQQ
jgi:hypothetical protein